MASWRKLHSKILDSPDFNNLPSDFDRLVWVLIPLCLDREGRGIDDAAWLKSRLFPLRRDVEYEQIEATMSLLAERHMIIRYEANDRQCFYVPTWSKYQSIHPHEPQSTLPECPMKSDVTTLSLQVSDNVITMSPIEEIRLEESRGEESNPGSGDPSVKAARKQPDIHPSLQVWRDTHQGHYPTKDGNAWEIIVNTIGDKPEALVLWKKVIEGWVSMGWKSTNIAGMLDYYKRKEVPKPGRPSNGAAPERQTPKRTFKSPYD